MKRKTRWSIPEQALLLKRIGELLSRGYPLAEAIESLSLYLSASKREDLQDVLEKLKEGYPFYEVLESLHFDKNLVSYVYFSEEHGSLAEAIGEGSEMVLKREEDKRKLKNLTAYPIFLLVMTIFLFYFVERLLLPNFNALYRNMNVAPYGISNILKVLTSFLPLLAAAVFLFLAVFFACYFLIFKKQSCLRQKTLLAGLPAAGRIFRMLNSQFFAVQMSYLLSGGLSIMEALTVFENSRQSRFSQELGCSIKEKLRAGVEFDKVVTGFPFFEGEMSGIIRHGQNNGKLEKELYFYSRHCLEELEERIQALLKTIQPVLYTMIGVLIVSLYLIILLPMFQLIQGI